MLCRQAIPCRDRVSRSGARSGLCAHDRHAWVVRMRECDRNSRPRVATGFLCHDGAGARTGRPRSRQGSLGTRSQPWTVSRPNMDKVGRPCVAIGDQSSSIATEKSLS